MLKIVEEIKRPINQYELVLTYAHRDDELEKISHFYGNKETFLEIAKIVSESKYNEENLHKVENFTKYFHFSNIKSDMDEEDFENWKENKYDEYEDEERILWDYETCSGEILLQVYSFNLFWYDGNGNKFRMEMSK